MCFFLRLIDKVYELGFEICGGDLFWDLCINGENGVKKGYGVLNSRYKLKIVIDLNFFKDGVFM